MSQTSKKIQQRVRKGRRMGRAESKAEMEREQKPLARANKLRAVNEGVRRMEKVLAAAAIVQ